jgi:hypothetical protein
MNLYPGWKGTEDKRPERLQQMHRVHGRNKDHQCGECVHLLRMEKNKAYFKCKEYGVSNGAATDWRMKFEACGLFKTSQG